MIARRGRGISCGNETTENEAPNLDSTEAMHATMQAMQQELATLRQAVLNASTGGATVGTRGVAATCNIPTVGAIATGSHQEPIPVSGISLMHWIDMKLDHVDGSGSPVDAVDWLTYVEDKIEVFEVVYRDRVRYGT